MNKTAILLNGAITLIPDKIRLILPLVAVGLLLLIVIIAFTAKFMRRRLIDEGRKLQLDAAFGGFEESSRLMYSESDLDE